jgi:hypothetical protein
MISAQTLVARFSRRKPAERASGFNAAARAAAAAVWMQLSNPHWTNSPW